RHLWFIALSNLLVNLDGPINNPQNYYIYKDDAGRFNPIPWDFNESFGGFKMHQTLGNLSTTQLQQFSPFANLTASAFPIISKILSNPTYRKMYVAHMKTILEENFANGLYETRALEIQGIIGDDVQADPNKFYSYNNFITNLYASVGGGPQAVIGITQLMDARVDYIQSLTEFQYAAPEIGNVAHSPAQVSPNSEVWFTAEVTNVNDVFLAYRYNTYGTFTKVAMFDDGSHEDGQAGDGVYGASVTVGSTDMQYYIYTENSNAVAFSPARAEYEFYSISITGELVINEFMADNESTITDQDGDYDDWIELYNNGSEDLNLTGYYLSDDAADPYQWIFPDTTIMAGGYLIIWADDDGDQEGLHANFKLSKSGETIVLSDNNMNLLDEVSFLQQKTDTTTGRFENGTGDFIEMLPTFGAENTDLLTGIGDYAAIENTGFTLEQNRPNPFSGSTNIVFQLEEGSEVVLNVHNIYGGVIQTLVSGYLPAGEYSYIFQAGNLPKSLYFYSLSVGGKVQVKKMVVQ
ncbi:MAG TPA: lamin tail domain-containing protein, partial [Bacteroidales bacterium]